MRCESDYRKKLKEMVDAILDRSYELDMSLVELAASAGVSLSTVRNLDDGKTRFPHLRTVYLMAKAVGLGIVLQALQASAGRLSKGKPRLAG